MQRIMDTEAPRISKPKGKIALYKKNIDRSHKRNEILQREAQKINEKQILPSNEVSTAALILFSKEYTQKSINARTIRQSGGKDRHSKVFTSKGPRDRRIRLSVPTAIQLYDVQDKLGFDQPSKAVEWLIKNAKTSIDELDHTRDIDMQRHKIQRQKGRYSSTLNSAMQYVSSADDHNHSVGAHTRYHSLSTNISGIELTNSQLNSHVNQPVDCTEITCEDNNLAHNKMATEKFLALCGFESGQYSRVLGMQKAGLITDGANMAYSSGADLEAMMPRENVMNPKRISSVPRTDMGTEVAKIQSNLASNVIESNKDCCMYGILDTEYGCLGTSSSRKIGTLNSCSTSGESTLTWTSSKNASRICVLKNEPTEGRQSWVPEQFSFPVSWASVSGGGDPRVDPDTACHSTALQINQLLAGSHDIISAAPGISMRSFATEFPVFDQNSVCFLPLTSGDADPLIATASNRLNTSDIVNVVTNADQLHMIHGISRCELPSSEEHALLYHDQASWTFS